MQNRSFEQLFPRVIEELLTQTRKNSTIHVDVVAAHSRCGVVMAERILEKSGVKVTKGRVEVSQEDRLRLAIHAARAGMIREIANSLDWQEFEMFVERCLLAAAYEADRDVRVKDSGKLWQIDVVGQRPGIALCLDCKHWRSPSYPSKFVRFTEHQCAATRAFLSTTASQEAGSLLGLPILVTLLDPRERIQKGVVLVSIDQLPSFLTEMPSHLAELPFIKLD